MSLINIILNQKNDAINRLTKEILTIFWGLSLSVHNEINLDKELILCDSKGNESQKLLELLFKRRPRSVTQIQYYGFIGELISMNAGFINRNADTLYNCFEMYVLNDISIISQKIRKTFESEETEDDSSDTRDKNQLINSFMAKLKEREESSWKSAKTIIFVNFLKLFSNMTKITDKPFKNKIEASILELCMFNKENYFEYCIKIFLRINSEILDGHRDLFNSLKDTKALKNTLINFKWDKLTQTETELYLKFLQSSLITLFFTSKGQKNKSYMMSKQNAILNFIADLPIEHRKTFVNRFLDYLGFNTETLTNNLDNPFFLIEKQSVSAMIKFVNFVRQMVKNFGIMARSYAETLFSAFVSIFDFYTEINERLKVMDEDEENLNINKKKVKQIRKLVLDLLIDFYICYVDVDYEDNGDKLISLLKPRLEIIHNLPIASTAHILKLVTVWSEIEVYKLNFLKHPYILESVIRMIDSEQSDTQQSNKVLKLLINVILYSGKDDQYQLKSGVFEEEFNKNSLNFGTTDEGNKLLYEKSNGGQRISIIGRCLIERNSNTILKLINNFNKKEKEERGSKYIPSDSFLELVKIMMTACDINDQEELGICLDLFKSILNPKVINSKTLEKQKDSAQLYVLKEKSKAVFLSLFELVAAILQRYTGDKRFFTNVVMNLFIELKDVDLFLSLDTILKAAVSNPLYSSLSVPLLFLRDILTKNKKMDDNLNYDVIYERLEEIETKFLDFDQENMEIFLMTTYKLLKVKDLSVKRLSLSIFTKYFDNVKNSQIDDSTRNIILRLINNFKSTVKAQLPSDEKFKYILLFFNAYLIFNSQVPLDLPYKDLVVFANDNLLISLIDLKLLNRIQALNKINDILANQAFSYPSLSGILLPLIENLMFSKLDEFDNKYNNSIQNSHFINYSNKVIESVQQLTLQYSSSQIINYIIKKVNFLNKGDIYADLLVKLISKGLSNFSDKSSLQDIVKKIDAEMRRKSKNLIEKDSLFLTLYKKDAKKDEANRVEETGMEIEEAPQESELKKLRKHALPALKKLLYTKKEDADIKSKPVLCDAVLKIIRLSGIGNFKREFARLVSELGGMMKSKQAKVRNQAIKVLFNIAVLNGPFFIHFIIEGLIKDFKEVRHRHIRNYTISYLLERLVIKRDYTEELPFEIGNLDYCMKSILFCIVEESFSDMYDEKQDDNFKGKSKEVKQYKSKNLMKVIGGIVDIRGDKLFVVVNRLLEQLKNTKELIKAVDKVNGLLDMLVKGLVHNKSNCKEAIFYIAFYYNNLAAKNLIFLEENKPKSIKNKFEHERETKREDLSRQRHQQNFEIQKGAAQGKSICKLISQSETRSKGVPSINNR